MKNAKPTGAPGKLSSGFPLAPTQSSSVRSEGCAASHLKPHLESTEDQSLAVERHIPFQPGIRHDLGVDRVALRAIPIDNPGEDDDLVLLGVHGTGKGSQFPNRHVVADALDKGKRAIFLPDFAGFSRLRLVRFDLVLW